MPQVARTKGRAEGVGGFMNCKLHIVGPLLILVLASAGCGAGDSSSSVSEDMPQDKVRVKVNDARVQGSYQTEQSSSYEYLKTGLLEGIQSRFPDTNAEEIAMAVIDAIDAESNGQLALINKKNHALWAGILAGSAVFPRQKERCSSLFLSWQCPVSKVMLIRIWPGPSEISTI